MKDRSRVREVHSVPAKVDTCLAGIPFELHELVYAHRYILSNMVPDPTRYNAQAERPAQPDRSSLLLDRGRELRFALFDQPAQKVKVAAAAAQHVVITKFWEGALKRVDRSF